MCSPNTASYCNARARIPTAVLRCLARRTAQQLQAGLPDGWKWNGRSVFIADGSHVWMPDTPENRAVYPQPVVQQPGIGFPLARVAVLLSLATGACHDLAIAPYAGKGTGETTLLRRMYDSLCPRRRGPGRRPVRQLLPRLRVAVARRRAGRPRTGGAGGEPDGGESARRRRHPLAKA